MSVVGLDVGNDSSCVAMARKRGVDVLLNRESNRETPAVVHFGDKMRFMGTDGAAKTSLSPQNTVFQLKRIIGKKFSDPAVQADIAQLPFSVTEGPDGGCIINVTYCNEPHSFTPEQLIAMVLVDLKKIAEAESGVVPTDCCISVPTYFNQTERIAMLNAATIAGLNCLRLINENTATALAYGIYKTDLPENEPVHVMFVDMGHSSTQVSVVALKKNGLQVKSHAWDRDLGGRDFDTVLFDHFAAEFKEKFRIDIKSNKKAAFKLRTAVEKVKKMLSANPQAPINIECIMEDTDVRGMMTREEFEKLAEPLLARVRAPIEKALAEAGITADQLSSVEIVGSSTRMPAVYKIVEEITKRMPSRTMNSKECVSRGCALQCAMLSPVFKVREFEVIDACPYTIEFRWDKDGEEVAQKLFERNGTAPSTKMLTFLRAQPFSISAYELEGSGKVGEYTVGPFEVPAGAEKAKLKVKVKLNLHGLVSVEEATAVVEEAAEAAPAPEAAPAADGAAPAPMDTDAAAAGEAKPAAKKKVKKHEVAVAAAAVPGLALKRVEELFEREGQMQASDHLQTETNERKNALEGYVYDLRNKLYGQYAPFVKEGDKESLMGTLQAVEDWLYDEGEDTTKSVYIAKLDELKKLGGPVEQRAHEDQARGPAVESLRSVIREYTAVARSDAAHHAHITPEERATIEKECGAAQAWIDEKVSLQSQLAKHDPPVLLSSDAAKKRETLDRVCKPIATKPVPKPAAKPAPAPAPEPKAEATPEPMDADAPAAGAAPEGEQPMEQ